LKTTSAGTWLKINRKKTELMKINNTTANTPITASRWRNHQRGGVLSLPVKCGRQAKGHRNDTARIGKAKGAFVMLNNAWASKQISMRTKIRIFNSNVKSVLYGCETKWTTETILLKIQTFFNTCVRCIYNIRWPDKIRNEGLWERAGDDQRFCGGSGTGLD
jgi:hypothetical protein